jgi:hypothetical protein
MGNAKRICFRSPGKTGSSVGSWKELALGVALGQSRIQRKMRLWSCLGQLRKVSGTRSAPLQYPEGG